MKKLFKAGLFSATLVVAALLLNNTVTNTVSAAGGTSTGTVTFTITGGTITCDVGSNITLPNKGVSMSTGETFSGFTAASGTTTWSCLDMSGTAIWHVDLSSSTVENLTIPNHSRDIPNSSVYVKNDTATLTANSTNCTVNSGVSQGNYVALTGTTLLFGKDGNIGDLCGVETKNVTLKVFLTGGQAAGNYSGTLTIDEHNI